MKKSYLKPITLLIFGIILFSCSKNEVQTVVDNTKYITQYQLNKDIVSINTTNVAAGIETIFTESIFDSTARATFSQTFVEGARFYDDKSGYFYIETLKDAWVIAHVNQDIIATSRIDVQDDYGKYFIREMVETVTYSGHGFVDYYRINPANQEYERKLGYVTHIPSADWFIGSGFYGGEEGQDYTELEAKKLIIKETNRTLANGISQLINELYVNEDAIITFCREFIDHMRFFDDGSGYFFINDLNGISIANGANEANQGTNDYNIQDVNGAYIIQDMIYIVQNQEAGYYQYTWENPNNGEQHHKTTYISIIPGTPYFIGCGFYNAK